MPRELYLGARVQTPFGEGTILSRRYASPDYTLVESYSVFLDAKKEASERPPFPNYHGTTVPASQVEPID